MGCFDPLAYLNGTAANMWGWVSLDLHWRMLLGEWELYERRNRALKIRMAAVNRALDIVEVCESNQKKEG